MIGKAFFNRAPLQRNKLAALPVGAVKPAGWLQEQLRIQADGLSGKLFELWPDVGENCGWLGGDGDGWERAPYYLDGLVPLAYQLEDEKLIGLCERYIEWTLESQREDGFFGPASNEDWWPRMVMLKALEQYFTATGDRRVLGFMDRYFRYQLRVLDQSPLRGWAVARGGENMRSVLWLYNITGLSYLLKLCQKLREQTLDWTSHFNTFPHILPTSKKHPWTKLKQDMQDEANDLCGANQPYYHREYHLTHGVNIAMGLKMPGIVNLFKSGYKELKAFEVGYQKLMKHHGVASGMFSCDEHLNGASPAQGSELCAVVELMHTIEVLLQTGDEFGTELPDILEKLAYNALPSAFDADMMNHQYDQQANQVKVSKEPRSWYNNGDDANLYGLEPNFGCCTANMHQGWPKFVASLWYATSDEGLAAISYAPCTVNFVAGGERVKLVVDSCYPFDSQVSIEVSVKKPTEFPLYLRIPGWAKQAMIRLPDGEIMALRSGENACVRRKWSGTERVVLDLSMEPRVTKWYHQSAAVELGPLLMCYRPKERLEALADNNISVQSDEPWNWALLDGECMKGIVEPDKARAFKHSDAARVLVKAALVENWEIEGGSAQQPPIQPTLVPGSEQVIELVPFGNSMLRISQFPLCAKPEEPTE